MTAGAAPPFRADRIGSLRRPAELEEAHAHFERVETSAEALAEGEDRPIRTAVAKRRHPLS